MQDPSNACNMNRDIGYTSWSLICRDADHRKTTCSILLDSMMSQFTDIRWKKSAKYVGNDELRINNFDPIIINALDGYELKTLTDIQNFTEIKDGFLQLSFIKIGILIKRVIPHFILKAPSKITRKDELFRLTKFGVIL